MTPAITTTGVAGRAKVLPMSTSTRALSKTQSDRVRERLLALKKRYGSQTRLSREIDVSQQVISRILNGDPAGLYVATKIAKAMKLPSVEMVFQPSTTSLEEALSLHPKRWHAAAVNAVRTMPGFDRLDIERLIDLLDRADSALEPIHRELGRIRPGR